jgi:hypothetical protein
VTSLVPFHTSMGWAMQVALIWTIALGGAGGAWIAGYHMGYRRGVKDAITGDIVRADHRVNVD